MEKEYINNNILRINIIPILSGNCFLCLFSIMVNIIEILIILSLKFLHSILYHLFFLISINEIINCIFHIFQSILIIYDLNIKVLYVLNLIIIYFTDTFAIILLYCLCDSMNNLILKQKKKLSISQTYKLFSYIFSLVLTTIYFLFYIINSDDKKFIYSEIISWKFVSNENTEKINLNSANSFSYFFTIAIYSLIIAYSFYLIIKINCFIKEKSQEESKSKNWGKLKEFRIKMMKYPFFFSLWMNSLILYSLFEFFNGYNKEIKNLKIKYFLYFVYCFISSSRGILFFKLFISNEKIKKYIHFKIKNIIFFDNVLKDEIEEIIDTPSNNNSKYTISETDRNTNSLFQEGLIDDRDMKIEKKEEKNEKEDNNDDDSDDDEGENIVDNYSAKNFRNNITDNITQSLSSLNESKKVNNSQDLKGKKNPLNISGFN